MKMIFFIVFSLSLTIAHSQILGFSCTSSTRFCPNVSSEITCNTTSSAIRLDLSGDIDDQISFPASNPVGTNITSDQNDDFTAIKTGDMSFILNFTSLIEFDDSLTVTCIDLADVDPNTADDSCIIMIYDIPSTSPTIPVPGYTDISFNSVTLSWNPSTEQCIDHYNITVTRNNMNPVDMISDTTSYVYPIDRGAEYCFTVSVVDGANRRGPDSMSRCLTAEVPEVPDITLQPTNYPDNPDDPVEVFIDIEQPDSSRPEVLEYIVIHDVNINITPNTITLSSPTTTTTLTGAIRGSVYTIQVQPSNTLGTGSIASATVAIPSVEPPPIITSISSSMTITMSTSTTPSVTPNLKRDTQSGGLGGGAIAGIVIAGITVVIVIIIVVGIIIFFVVKGNNGGVKPVYDNDQENYAQLEMSDNSKKSSKGGSKQKFPKSQPQSVQYSDIKQPKQTNYAELDLDKGKNKKPLSSSVEYSGVRHE